MRKCLQLVKLSVRFWSLPYSLHWVFVFAMVAALYVLSLLFESTFLISLSNTPFTSFSLFHDFFSYGSKRINKIINIKSMTDPWMNDFDLNIFVVAESIPDLLAAYNTRVYSWDHLCSLCHYLCWSWAVLWWS